jgi:CubicO group peptidase (beta-lactamase class C family)
MQDYRPEEGRYHTESCCEHPAYFLRSSARDLARFGLLYLQRGRWREKQLLPAAWVDASVRSYSIMASPPSAAPATGYGFMWWTQARVGAHPGWRALEGGYTAAGAGGQRLAVLPRIETVIVHLVDTERPGPRLTMADWDRLLARVLEARQP